MAGSRIVLAQIGPYCDNEKTPFPMTSHDQIQGTTLETEPALTGPLDPALHSSQILFVDDYPYALRGIGTELDDFPRKEAEGLGGE